MKIYINGKYFTVLKSKMTGRELKAIGNVGQGYVLYRELPSPKTGIDEKIGNDCSIEIKEGDIFYDIPPGVIGWQKPSAT